MRRRRADLCLLYRQDGENLGGMVILQVRDSFIAGSPLFLIDEDTESKVFFFKLRQPLMKHTIFNGLELFLEDRLQLSMTHYDMVKIICTPHDSDEIQELTRADSIRWSKLQF